MPGDVKTRLSKVDVETLEAATERLLEVRTAWLAGDMKALERLLTDEPMAKMVQAIAAADGKNPVFRLTERVRVHRKSLLMEMVGEEADRLDELPPDEPSEAVYMLLTGMKYDPQRYHFNGQPYCRLLGGRHWLEGDEAVVEIDVEVLDEQLLEQQLLAWSEEGWGVPLPEEVDGLGEKVREAVILPVGETFNGEPLFLGEFDVEILSSQVAPVRANAPKPKPQRMRP